MFQINRKHFLLSAKINKLTGWIKALLFISIGNHK